MQTCYTGNQLVCFLWLMMHLCNPLSAQQAEPARQSASVIEGLVPTQPEQGRFVVTPMGYMVPYTAKIPGSDVTFEMIPVPNGTFRLGSDRRQIGHDTNEAPQVRFEMSPFWIGRTEVTWAEFADYMNLGFYFKSFERFKMREVNEDNQVDVITAPSTLYDPVYTFTAGGTRDHPAISMTQFTAKQYTQWLSKTSGTYYRLPSEAEWEYACRAGSDTAWSFGNNPRQLAEYGWFRSNSGGERHAIAQKKPNAWGIHDMHGNAAEWVLDADPQEGYLRLLKTKDRSNTNVIGWPTGLYGCIVRGGSYQDPVERCRSAARSFSDEDWFEEDASLPQSPFWFASDVGLGVGFRIVRPLQPPETEQAKARFWSAGNVKLQEILEIRIDQSGRGAWGIADGNLPQAMKDVRKSLGRDGNIGVVFPEK